MDRDPYKIIGWLTAQMQIHAWRIEDAIREKDNDMEKKTIKSMVKISKMSIDELQKEVKKMEGS